ncbi:MAG: DUF4190 domain-containing protein [Ruminiclostridium sp.]|nr:DUF4190 domain-containing protein [Ruminiclostridium sp.]
MTTKNKAIVSLVCGIVGLVGGWIPVVQYITGILSILGIVFGAMALKDKPEGSEKGMAVTGLVLGIVACAITLLVILCAVCALAAIGSVATQYGTLQ